jgi:hypothetical protein
MAASSANAAPLSGVVSRIEASDVAKARYDDNFRRRPWWYYDRYDFPRWWWLKRHHGKNHGKHDWSWRDDDRRDHRRSQRNW